MCTPLSKKRACNHEGGFTLVELLVDCPTARLDHWCQTARNRDGGNVVPFFLRKLLEGPVLVHPDVVQHKDTLRLLDG